MLCRSSARLEPRGLEEGSFASVARPRPARFPNPPSPNPMRGIEHAGDAGSPKSRFRDAVWDIEQVVGCGDLEVRRIAGRQRGLIRREQLLAAGVGRGAIAHRRASRGLPSLIPGAVLLPLFVLVERRASSTGWLPASPRNGNHFGMLIASPLAGMSADRRGSRRPRACSVHGCSRPGLGRVDLCLRLGLLPGAYPGRRAPAAGVIELLMATWTESEKTRRVRKQSSWPLQRGCTVGIRFASALGEHAVPAPSTRPASAC